MNKSFKFKLILLCVFLSIVSISISTVSYFGISKLSDESHEFSRDIIPRSILLNEMDVSYQKTRIAVRTLGLEDNTASESEAAINSTLEMIAKYDTAAKKLKSKLHDENEKEIFNNLEKEWGNFKAVGARAIELAKDGSVKARKELLEIFHVHCPEAAESYQVALDLYTKEISQEVVTSAAAFNQTVSSLNYTLLIVSIVGVILGLSAGVVYANKISLRIRETLERLTKSSNFMTKSANNISLTSNNLTSSSRNQDLSLQESSAAIEQVSSMIKVTSNNAQESTELAKESLDKAAFGQKIVKKMIDSMNGIDSDIVEMVEELGSNTEKMQQIISLIEQIEERTQVINDIVFQTKLLSFNASVEAARAGESGKGFSVVAEEVGKLAEMSGHASVDISEMVSSSVKEVNRMITESNETLNSLVSKVRDSVNSGTKVAGECGDILESIVESVDDVTKAINEISTATFEQAKGIEELQSSISSIDLSSRSNTGIAEEASKVAGKLLNEVVHVNKSIDEIETAILGDEAAPKAA
ncbi:signal transduction four helix bundle sensory module [Halobacteriovorax sp. BALOs_7]|uniref:HAMP domain-containing methyl-accepting chemotaxis protein n=1 Tax=Halobacteriovorax sp. BALOs_7 TaxID=2109558 RepID=UPI000EA0175C|nr:methyl-accepting chemotaxis protein [Halobacteriovorax sp. BALOs_7]AYF45390.1 signal transduction four helix bundle sensory module [Halobacteriovorax sp. BALOs_7]